MRKLTLLPPVKEVYQLSYWHFPALTYPQSNQNTTSLKRPPFPFKAAEGKWIRKQKEMANDDEAILASCMFLAREWCELSAKQTTWLQPRRTDRRWEMDNIQGPLWRFRVPFYCKWRHFRASRRKPSLHMLLHTCCIRAYTHAISISNLFCLKVCEWQKRRTTLKTQFFYVWASYFGYLCRILFSLQKKT